MRRLGPMNDELRAVAESQGGVFTTRQAHAAGYDKWGLLRLVHQSTCEHLARGVYAVPPSRERTDVDCHLLLARGNLLLYPDARLAGHSALAAWELPVWGADLGRAHLERPVQREVLTAKLVIRPPLVVPPTLTTAASRRSLGVPAALDQLVHPAVAVVQHCLESGPASGIAAADAALHAEMVTTDDLYAVAAAVHGWPRSARVRTMMAHADGRSESVGESRLRFALAVAGIELEPQVVIVDVDGRFVARVDFVVKGTKVVVEFDGKVKYTEGGPDALMAEKRREDRLRRLGYTVVRVTWGDLYQLPIVVGWIRKAMEVGAR
jgi:very-short-patch-repair endonuclease